MTWDSSPGDRGYRVWRMRDGKEECLTDAPVADASYDSADTHATDWYAVSAITSAQETLEATLHLHQFLLLSRRESRRSVWIRADGEEMERYRFGEALPETDPEVLRSEIRCAECSPVEDMASPRIADDDPHGETKRAVIVALTEWKQAIEAEDIERLLECYAPDYREPDGRTVESVNVVFRSVLWRYLKDQHGALAEEWSRVPAWSYPVVRAFIRDWCVVSNNEVRVQVAARMWAGCGPELEPSDMFKHPLSGPCDVTMTWRRRHAGWKLAETTPAFLRMEDTVPFRFSYQGW